METAIWQDYQEDDVMVIGISNTQNVNEFVDENNLTFPILFDPGSNGGVDGGDTYDLYYLPNDGSPYPRDFIIGPDGIVEYANNEIDFTWMLYILDELLGYNDQIPGDVNYDGTLNILDIVIVVNMILGNTNTDILADVNEDGVINVLDIVILISLILS